MAPDPNRCLFLFDKDFRSDRVKKGGDDKNEKMVL